MAFVKVGNHLVFLDDTRMVNLRAESFEMDFDRGGLSDVQYRIRAMRDGATHEATLERMHSLLQRKLRSDPLAFEQDWVQFDLRENDARRNVNLVVGDQFVMLGILRFGSDLFRGFHSDPIRTGLSLNDDNPGCEFTVRHALKTPWLSRRRDLTLELSTDDVVRVAGCLQDFTVDLRSARLRFSASGIQFQSSAARAIHASPPD